MNKKIEKYIVFVIENGLDTTDPFGNGRYEYRNYDYEIQYGTFNEGIDEFDGEITPDTHIEIWAEGQGQEYSLAGLITSKGFLKSLAKGITKDWCETEDYETMFKEKVKWLAIHQAIAIMNDDLEEFIDNILPKS